MDFNEKKTKMINDLLWKLVYMMPDKFVFMCFCAIVYKVTTGVYENTEITGITVGEILRRLNKN